MADKAGKVTPDDFDADCADRVAELIGVHRDRLDLSPEEIRWGQRMLWTLGQTPAITNAAQFDEYAARLSQLLVDELGQRASDRSIFSAFVKTPSGATAVALVARMNEWRRRASN